MLYSDLYDEYLDELYRDCLDSVPFLCSFRPSRLMAEHDPIGYRCGFGDWSDSMDSPMLCPECGEHDISPRRQQDASMYDIVECGVCAGEEFVCDECGEVLDNANRAKEGEDVCQSCYDQRCEKCGGDNEDNDEEEEDDA